MRVVSVALFAFSQRLHYSLVQARPLPKSHLPPDDPGTARCQPSVVSLSQALAPEPPFLIPPQRLFVALPHMRKHGLHVMLAQDVRLLEYAVQQCGRDADVSVRRKQA